MAAVMRPTILKAATGTARVQARLVQASQLGPGDLAHWYNRLHCLDTTRHVAHGACRLCAPLSCAPLAACPPPW